MSNIIGVDIDGVLADFNTGYRKAIQQRFPAIDIPECGETFPDCWDWEKKIPISKQMENEVWEKDILANYVFWSNLPSYPWTQQVIHGIFDSSRPIYFITSRSGVGVKIQTENWLRARALPFQGWCPTVLVVPNHRNKVDILNGLGVTHYLDDRLATVYHMANKVNTRLYLLNQPWNQTTEDGNWQRINNINTFLIEAGV